MEVVVNVGFSDGIAGEVTLRRGFNRIRECFAVHLLPGMNRNQPVLRFTSGLNVAAKRGHFGLLGLRITFRGVPYTFGLLAIRKGMSGSRVQRPDGLYDFVVDIAPVQVTTLWPARTPFTVRTVNAAEVTSLHPVSHDWLVPSNQMPGAAFTDVHQNLENRVIEALRTGANDWGVDLCFSDMGPWRPMGLREGYTEGGNGVCPCPGFEYRDNLNLLRADCWAERTRIDLFDSEGNPATYTVKPDLQRTGNFMDRWGGPDWAKPFNDGYNAKPESWTPTSDCAYTGNLLTYDGVDMEHGIRQAADSMAGAARGDKACAINVEQIGRHILAAMPADRLVSPTVDQRGGLGRLHGWAAWTMAGLAQLYSRGLVPTFNNAPRAMERGEAREWVKEMARLFVKAQTPSGLWQAVAYPWPNWSPPPQKVNVPTDRLLAQSHEHGILIAGAFACWSTLIYPDERRLRNALGRAIMRAAEVWTRDGAPTARKWLVAGVLGDMGDQSRTLAEKVIETHGDEEGLYRFWSAAYASIVANTPEDNLSLAEKLRTYGRRWLYGRPDPTRFARAILKMADVQTPAQLHDYWLNRFPSVGERDEHQLFKDEPLLRQEGEKLVPAMIVLGR